MNTLPSLIVVSVSHADDVNSLFSALGEGTQYLTRKMCAIDPEATYETPPTHWITQDMSATVEKLALWVAIAAGDLPDGIAWGEDGVISEQDAIAAASNIQVHSYLPDANGVPTVEQWLANTLGLLGIQFVPDEPI